MKDLIKIIEKELEGKTFTGVVSIFEENEAIYNQAFGFRNIKEELPNDIDTIFGIASGTKIFTALGIGKLIERNELSFDTKVSEIDTEFVGFIDENATIGNLLTHTSGVYDYLDEEVIEDYESFSIDIPWYKLTTPSDYYPLFINNRMKFQAGERYSYSNGGYVLLGIIIERITKQLYRDFIKDNVLLPSGMIRSGFYAFNDLPPNTANGYLEDGKTTNIYKIPIRGGGDGGMYTTTRDLDNFWRSFISNKVLSQQLTQEYLKTHVSFGDRAGYGCGLYKGFKTNSYFVVGSDAGVSFESRYFADSQTVINILSNKTNGDSKLGQTILNHIMKG